MHRPRHWRAHRAAGAAGSCPLVVCSRCRRKSHLRFPAGLTSRQLVEAYLARIRAYDQAGPKINAFITLNPRALQEADALDAERKARGSRGPLHGIPIVIKDNYATAGMPTTGGSKSLEGFETGRDAFMVKKLRDAGAIVMGTTNLHELAYGITSISSDSSAGNPTPITPTTVRSAPLEV